MRDQCGKFSLLTNVGQSKKQPLSRELELHLEIRRTQKGPNLSDEETNCTRRILVFYRSSLLWRLASLLRTMNHHSCLSLYLPNPHKPAFSHCHKILSLSYQTLCKLFYRFIFEIFGHCQIGPKNVEIPAL